MNHLATCTLHHHGDGLGKTHPYMSAIEKMSSENRTFNSLDVYICLKAEAIIGRILDRDLEFTL